MSTSHLRVGRAAFLLSLLIPSLGSAQPSTKLDDSLRESVARGCSGTQKIIVRTVSGARQQVSTSLKAHGAKVHGEFPSIDAVSATVSCADLKALAGSKSTQSISIDADLSPTASNEKANPSKNGKTAVTTATTTTTTTTTLSQQDAAAKLQAKFFQTLLSWTDLRAASYLGTTTTTYSGTTPTASYLSELGLTGVKGGVGVGIIDSGIAPGPDFGTRITGFYDFTEDDTVVATAPNDGYGHGTHVAGLIASQYVGVAPGAHVVGLKVLNSVGKGSTSMVLRAIEFAILNKQTLNLQVLNLSLGHPIYEPAATDPLVQAVERAVRAGFVVVVSAGNFGINPATGQPGYAGIASPGNAPSAVTVGAVQTFDTVARADDRVAPYSSRGPSWYDGFAKPDVVAPGDNLLSVAAPNSTLRKLMEAQGNVGDYMRLSGTSMAAAVVSGAVALVMDINPKLTPNALKAVMEYTAIPVRTSTGQSADALTQGAGQINGLGGATLAYAINASAAVGQKWYTMAIPPSTVIESTTYAWSQAIVWGNHLAYGTGVMDEQREAWSMGVVWGELPDDNIVWGNSLVWGDTFDSGDNIVWGNNIVWDESLDNIVWGNTLLGDLDNIVWGNNVVWGSSLVGVDLLGDDNIVWGNNIAWGSTPLEDDNIVWGNLYDDNIVWGNTNPVATNDAQLGIVIQLSSGVAAPPGKNLTRRTQVRKEGVQ